MRKEHKKLKRFGIMAMTAIMTLSLSGCDLNSMFGGGGGQGKGGGTTAVITEDGVVTGQTASGIWSKSRDFESQLESGRFYVVQGEYYYPVIKGYIPMEEDEIGTTIDPTRKMFFLTQDEVRIPTFYKDQCELVYYSKTGLLDFIAWERYSDEGYTLGLWDIQEMISGRIFINTDQENDKHICIYPGKPTEAIYNYETEPKAILIDKIGNVQANKDFLYDGMINPEDLTKNQEYDLALYDGTHYHHFKEAADMHYFKAYELFASIEYETMQQENFYHVEIPDYFVTGYYRIKNGGLLRFVDGDSWGPDTDFNEQLLFPSVQNETVRDHDEDEYIAPSRYSTYEPLNLFRTNIEGKLGYVPQDSNGNWILVNQNDDQKVDEEREKILEATTKEVEVWLPKGVECTVDVVSSTGEKTGDIYLKIGDKEKKVVYNRLEDKYSLTIKGKDQRATLVITGLFSNYEVHLSGTEQYRGQDNAEGTEGTDSKESVSNENEKK